MRTPIAVLALLALGPLLPAPARALCPRLERCTLESPTRTCLFSFGVPDAEVLRVEVREEDPSLDAAWRLVTAAGQPAAACGSLRAATANDCGPLAAGEYVLQITPAAGTGTAAVRLQGLTGCGQTPLGCDEAVEAALGTAAESRFFRFSSAAGEVVRVTVRELAAGLEAEWRLLTGAGGRASVCDTFRRSLAEDCGPLEAGELLVQVRDEAGAGSGGFAVHLQRLAGAHACDAVPIVCDGTVVADVAPGIDSDLLPFSVETGEVARITVAPRAGALRPEWRLLTAAGFPAGACGVFSTVRAADCGPLSGGGYAIHVKDDASRNAGTYEASLVHLVHQCANCGNGIVTAGEECDPPGGCCTAACRIAPAGTVCRPVAGACDVPETCTGASATCPTDRFVASGTVCRLGTAVCDQTETCSGRSAACPPDGFRPPDAVCRPPATECDAAEFCTGASAACPPDAKSRAVCRPAAGPCDVAERCDGHGEVCPPDAFLPAGTVCRPSRHACDAVETCRGDVVACPPDLLPAGTCGDGCLNAGEECGEGGASACPAGRACAGCRCVPCVGAVLECAAPADGEGRVVVRLAARLDDAPAAAYRVALGWDPALLRFDTLVAPEARCSVDDAGGSADCRAGIPAPSGDEPGAAPLGAAVFTVVSSTDRLPVVQGVLRELDAGGGAPLVVCQVEGSCVVPECVTPADCRDGDACEARACVEQRCRRTPLVGFDGADCEVGRLLGALGCGGKPGLARRAERARRALARAETTDDPRRRVRLLRRADRLLGVVQRAGARSRALPTDCRQTVVDLAGAGRTSIAGLVAL